MEIFDANGGTAEKGRGLLHGTSGTRPHFGQVRVCSLHSFFFTMFVEPSFRFKEYVDKTTRQVVRVGVIGQDDTRSRLAFEWLLCGLVRESLERRWPDDGHMATFRIFINPLSATGGSIHREDAKNPRAFLRLLRSSVFFS